MYQHHSAAQYMHSICKFDTCYVLKNQLQVHVFLISMQFFKNRLRYDWVENPSGLRIYSNQAYFLMETFLDAVILCQMSKRKTCSKLLLFFLKMMNNQKDQENYYFIYRNNWRELVAKLIYEPFLIIFNIFLQT